MSGFDPRWLEVREPADHSARSMPVPLELTQQFVRAVCKRAQGPVRLVDLAGGTGSNVRFLAPLISGEQHWTVWDSDAAVLALSHDSFQAWADEQGWDTSHVGDRLVVAGPDIWLGISLGVRDLREHLDFNDFDGVTCAALLDLVSAYWCEGLVEALDRAGFPPLLFSLVADQAWSWVPVLPDDGAVGELFRRDMGTDKGFGPSLGLDSTYVVTEMLRARGFTVDQAASPWHIGRDATELQAYLLDFQAAVIEGAGQGAGRWQDWLTARRGLLRQQKLCVNHREIFASR